MTNREPLGDTFWQRHPYLEAYLTISSVGTIVLGPIMLIGGIIEHGLTADAFIPFLALLLMAALILPLILLILALILGRLTY